MAVDLTLINFGLNLERPLEETDVLFVGHFKFGCPKFECKYRPDGVEWAMDFEEKGNNENKFIFNCNVKIIQQDNRCQFCGDRLHYYPNGSNIKKVTLTPA